MRWLFIFLFLTLVGCNSTDESSVTPVSNATLEVKHVGRDVPASTQHITAPMRLRYPQPALGWFPKFAVVGGVLAYDDNNTNPVVTPTAGTCTVTVTWQYLDQMPPAPPAANG